ncbi:MULTISPECIES: SprT family zinc-dependent metalloprotease [Alteromonadaceae]|uniref:SprT family zinc-dependent metalloprotease n=1 Tax=Alteromonadaceae TaxID=72275 RepID=UPI001C0950AC|nr:MULTISPECIES: SprT family zinc-dependent metalloprotease [Aliiglaciecola]MBU2877191.1 SprT family zinc-dependent metalloprotease [Aliiglaciecola lipolytica]MDO6712121.1 SprT family zinc-dependent metalloprotease [Aliiglaciecola sp. 2_MG-2023]MDO6753201.1 SprT family zinc-dependent metalloprotease [Aliiglaciecola sp. 1_MG-2023]
MISFAQQKIIQQRVLDCIQMAEVYFHRKFVAPTLMFNQRGNIAGTAHLQKNLIKLNSTLLMDNFDEFLVTVIPHEVAHIITFQLFKRVKPHGIEWQSIMNNVFNLPATVRHKMDTTKTQGKMFDYKCQCGTVKLTLRRHNKVVNKQQIYCCRKCQQELLEIT